MDYDNLKYDDELMYDIKGKISLIGIVDSYFKSIKGTFRENNMEINDEIKVKIYPNYKFFIIFALFMEME